MQLKKNSKAQNCYMENKRMNIGEKKTSLPIQTRVLTLICRRKLTLRTVTNIKVREGCNQINENRAI